MLIIAGSYSQHMNHRYAYCKPEDALMHELRQQMKKNNGDGNSTNGTSKQRKRRKLVKPINSLILFYKFMALNAKETKLGKFHTLISSIITLHRQSDRIGNFWLFIFYSIGRFDWILLRNWLIYNNTSFELQMHTERDGNIEFPLW